MKTFFPNDLSINKNIKNFPEKRNYVYKKNLKDRYISLILFIEHTLIANKHQTVNLYLNAKSHREIIIIDFRINFIVQVHHKLLVKLRSHLLLLYRTILITIMIVISKNLTL